VCTYSIELSNDIYIIIIGNTSLFCHFAVYKILKPCFCHTPIIIVMSILKLFMFARSIYFSNNTFLDSCSGIKYCLNWLYYSIYLWCFAFPIGITRILPQLLLRRKKWGNIPTFLFIILSLLWQIFEIKVVYEVERADLGK
jgi:hypothetical protein